MSMAYILFRRDGKNVEILDKKEEKKILHLDEQSVFYIYGKSGTYGYLSRQNDAIVVAGYACHLESDSSQRTLSTLLNSFTEAQIGDLKKKLVGQYVMMIKKGQNIYIFSDFCGSRNVFYSPDGLIISSSFSQIENLLQTNADDLDRNKVFEYLAMRYILFPSWLGRSTMHKRINWLLPTEYLVIDLAEARFNVKSLVFAVENSKESACDKMAKDLLSILKSIIYRPEYKDSLVASSLTGGRDTRLVAAMATDLYSNIKYRIAISSQNANSLKDLQVARKVAKTQGIPLDVYQYEPSRDEESFYTITEGLTPFYNHAITPLLRSAHAYALGFGGALGSQLFWPIGWALIEDFIKTKIGYAKKFVFVENNFWEYLDAALLQEFRRIKKAFQLSDEDERDYIRLFQFFNSARYSSFIISGHNVSGHHLEPYTHYPVLELALRAAPRLWGDHKKMAGDGLMQKMAMAIINPEMGKIIAYSSYRPMLPLSSRTYPRYLIGYAKHHVHWLQKKMSGTKEKTTKTTLLNGCHISNGWEKPFIDRIRKVYGLSLNADAI